MPKEYILKTTCKELIRAYCTGLVEKGKQKVEVTEFNANIQREINKIPAAEVAEIVRCGKCRYYAPTIKRCLNFCALDHPKPDDYCSFGERFSNEE